MSDDIGLPARGTDAAGLLDELTARRDKDADWRAGRTFSLVYNPADEELERLQERIALAYLHENYLNPFAFPSLLTMEREVVGMAAALLHGNPAGGRLTSGGTESIFLAVQVARDHARTSRGVHRPNLVLPATAHPAFAKAAHYLDVAEVRVPTGPDGRADVPAMAEACDESTCLVVGSAPCYPFGVVDPIEPLAGTAAERGVLCHVDACLGGWLLPFLERLGEDIPPWDLRVEGVTSLSADIHKYGWCFKGASVLLHRDRDLLSQQFFVFDGWPGGVYGSATTAGTRPAAPIAAAWATLRYLGEEGYLRLAGQVREVSQRLHEGVATIDGLHITSDPVPGVVEIASDRYDMSAVADVLDARGWHLDRQQGGLHAILSPSHLTVVDELLADLSTSVEITSVEGRDRDEVTSAGSGSYGGIA